MYRDTPIEMIGPFYFGTSSKPLFGCYHIPLSGPSRACIGALVYFGVLLLLGETQVRSWVQLPKVRIPQVSAKLATRREGSDVRLVMVGEHAKEVCHSYFGIIKKRVQGLGIADCVIFTGYRFDEALVVLLNLSTVLVLPSLMEGFGLLAIEVAARRLTWESVAQQMLSTMQKVVVQ